MPPVNDDPDSEDSDASVGEPSDLPTPPFDQVSDLADEIERDRVFSNVFGTTMEPRRMGRYVVLGTLGRGGMGTVLRAYDDRLDRKLALKILHRGTSEQHRQRLLREAQALARLSHPNVVQVYEVEEVDQQVFIAMELVSGKPLDRWQRSSRPWRECVEVYRQAGRGLAAAHAVGLVHRDFKPGNCIVDDEGRPRVLDFGLARELELPRSIEDESELEATAEPQDDALGSPLTRTGSVMGTVAYMPLEQLLGKPADERSDQFSFCVSLYEALYQERPFEGSSIAALMMSMTQGEVRAPPKDTRVPPRLRRVLLRGLATQPEDRWESMSVLLDQLEQLTRLRGRRWAALGLSVGLVSIGAGLWQQAEVGQRCEGAERQLEGIWDEARRAQVVAALLGTEQAHASDTSARVQRRLDDYAAAWTEAHTEVCEATSVRHEQSVEVMDLRMECLGRQRIVLRETVGVLTLAKPGVARRAVRLVAELPRIDRCSDVAALRALVPPPDDPQTAAEVSHMREELAGVRVLLQAGEYASGVELLEPLLERARALDYSPLIAELMLARGTAATRQGRSEDAERALVRAYELAVALDYERVEANAASHLVFTVGVELAKLDRGEQWAIPALALAERPTVPTSVRARAVRSMAMLRDDQGRYQEALEYHQRSLDMLEQQRGPQDLILSDPLINLGSALRNLGRFEEAETHYRRARALIESELGPTHPDVGRVINNLAGVAISQGRHERALELMDEALVLLENNMGPDHPMVASALSNKAGILLHLERWDEVRALSERALAIKEARLGPDHRSVAATLDKLAGSLMHLDQPEDARDRYERALSIRERTLGPDHTDTAETLGNLATLLQSLGDTDKALDYAERSVRGYEKMRPDHPMVAEALLILGSIRQARGEQGQARAAYERALSICESPNSEISPEVRAKAHRGLARIDQAEGQHTDARRHVERALELAESAAPGSLAQTRLVAADVLWAEPAERARAVVFARRARQAFIELSRDESLAKADAWLAEHAEHAEPPK